MHKPEDVNITYIPQDFKVAFTLFDLSIHHFLQFFIDHVSFYDALFPAKVDAITTAKVDSYELATRALQKYSIEKKERTSQEMSKPSYEGEGNLEGSVQAIKAMGEISIRTDLNKRQKRKSAEQMVQKLFTTFKTNTVKTTTLYLNKDQSLKLTPDFCLICELNRIGPIEYLSNVMEQISEAEIEARSGLNKGVENPAIGFYLRVRDGYGNFFSDDKPANPLMFDYLEDLQKLRLSLLIYRSVEDRVIKHRELLEKYYNLIKA